MQGCPYEIGVTRREDGKGWTLVWDTYRGSAISAYIGEDAQKFMCAYSEDIIQQYAAQFGCMMETTLSEDGTKKLVELTVV
jgi:hypothetical protein